ncbi:MAG: dickkopf-related protein [Polyangiaceae bacterium]
MRRRVRAAWLLGSGSLAVFAALAACSDYGPATLATPPWEVEAGAFDGGDPLLAGVGVGGACNSTNLVCRKGLKCGTTSVCEPGRSSPDGTACVISAECSDGLVCGAARTCTAGGSGTDGSACKSDLDCATGLRCNIVGFSAQCKPEGPKDVGGVCASSSDCFGGLTCTEKQCVPLPPSPTGLPPIAIPRFKAVACDKVEGPVKVHFRVPRGTNLALDQSDGDFFRLPFPNDVRLSQSGRRPVLTGFPTPGAELLGFDVVDRYLRYLEQTGDGWSAYTSMIFRFTGEVDLDSLKLAGALHLYDLTDKKDVGFEWSATTGRNNYVCENSLRMRPQAVRRSRPATSTPRSS